MTPRANARAGVRLRSVFYTLALTALLTACAAPPSQTLQTDLPLPEQFTVAQALAKTPKGGLHNEAWWAGFNDPLLNGLVELALGQNSRIAQSVAGLERSVAQLKRANAGDSFMSTLGLETQGNETNRATRGDESARSTLSLSFALPIDARGTVSAQVEAAAAGNRQAQAQLRNTLLNVSTEVAQEYLRYRGNQKQLELLIESLNLQLKTLRIVQVRNQTGLSPELDVQRARTSVENLRASIPNLQQALSQSRNRLATLTGQKPREMNALLQAPSALPTYANDLPAAVPLQVVQARPEVQASLAQVIQSMARVGVARTAFYPALRLRGRLELTHLSGTTPSSLALGTLAGLLEQALTDGQARQADLEDAQAQARQNLAAYEQQVRQVLEEVENQLAALENSKTRLVALGEAAKASRRSFEQADTLYQLGLVSFLDVVDSQRVRAGAEQALAAEQTRQATLIAGLFQRLGLSPP